MALGRSVVASQAGGLAEIVLDGATGWLVPPGDPDALAFAVSDVTPDAVAGLGKAGRARVESLFMVASMAVRALAAYTGLLDP